ncbi:iron ABC transporter permease [Shewanella baltica]|uniref:Binding-protein-dependent transport systems inner membrane component n=1 Tax=Shewanella baltica (strain OS195) TaxID=399599 RepID=A9L347_SHEB9|nr:iron ABC transporter permease [Shewanella baltica]ABX50976.1 binding-protein-dependent transport systems inner membrane component [Shewanella baltica OS195]ADT95977.1 binding-protein-dependent transport systems inner membrane component [Shewanella baltica OS678]EHC08031.1 binding-protein-dependent transport systems inner membrane component [Shewanella baltica OS625]MCS6229834.1 iron ABC transporter permease [Shewanella baltica]
MILGLARSWSLAGYAVATILVLPLVALILQALQPDEAVFGHLMATVLPTYIINSLLLIFWVSLGALLLALPCAWLMARCEFVGRRYLQWALLLPLAMPGYIVAYVYTDLLDYAGPVQRSLRSIFGWSSPQDYFFPDIRTLGGAACMLSLVLFPYIYLLARTAFMEQSLSLAHASRIMGCSPWQSFWRLSLPMARPALAVGVALVAMETAADFATVNYFAVPTLTTAVYDTWLGYGNLTAAAKLSAIILLVVFSLIGFERFARRKQQLFQKQSRIQAIDLYRLSAAQTAVALSFCATLLLLAFLLPFGILLSYAIGYFEQSWDKSFWQLSLNSLSLALITSFICCLIALLLMFVRRISPRSSDALPSRLASTGYALPGTVLAIGVLVPLTMLDFAINDLADLLGLDGPGLILTGSVVALIFAFCVRFVAIAIGSVESSYKRISPSLDMVSLTMGQGPRQLLQRVHLPLLGKGLFAGALLVFIESMKELPAALLLRPIGFENLATYVFQFVSDEKLEHGALAAIVIVLVGLVPLIYLNRSLEQHS